jgi:hypothetical protein
VNALFVGIAEEIQRLADEYLPRFERLHRQIRLSRHHRLKRQRRGRRW